MIIKGNHDVEFYWNKVRLKFKQLILGQLRLSYTDPKAREISERIEFCDRAYILEGKIYIAHGHQYEKITSVDKPTLAKGKGDQLTLPYGSLLNRYFLNKVERIAPYLDNIKPPTAYLDAVFKNHPIRSVRTVLKYLRVTWKMLGKHCHWQRVRLMMKVMKYSLIPLTIIFVVLLPSICRPFRVWLSSIPVIGDSLADIKIGAAISLISVVAPFILPTIMRKGHNIGRAMSSILHQHPELTHVILGHFHDPDQHKYGNCTYYNSGCWVPIINLQEKLRESVHFYLILIDKKRGGGFEEPLLRQWNDCSKRLEKTILIESPASQKLKKKRCQRFKKLLEKTEKEHRRWWRAECLIT